MHTLVNGGAILQVGRCEGFAVHGSAGRVETQRTSPRDYVATLPSPFATAH